MTKNRVWICQDHDLHWPIGGGSVVIAENVVEARKLLDKKLISHGLKPYEEKSYTFRSYSMNRKQAHIISDGDY